MSKDSPVFRAIQVLFQDRPTFEVYRVKRAGNVHRCAFCSTTSSPGYDVMTRDPGTTFKNQNQIPICKTCGEKNLGLEPNKSPKCGVIVNGSEVLIDNKAEALVVGYLPSKTEYVVVSRDVYMKQFPTLQANDSMFRVPVDQITLVSKPAPITIQKPESKPKQEPVVVRYNNLEPLKLTDKEECKVVPCLNCGRGLIVTKFYSAKKARCPVNCGS